MIKGTLNKVGTQLANVPTFNYRESNSLNQSMIKTYLNNPKKFYKEFVLKEKRKEKDSYSLFVGTLVDNILVKHKGNINEFELNFEEEFSLIEGKKSTSQLFDLADKLFEITVRDSNEENVVTTSFSVRFKESFEAMQALDKFKNKDELKALEMFIDTDAHNYLKNKLANIGKKVVDIKMVEHAKYICEKTLSDQNVSWIFKGNDNIEQINHFVIEWVYETLFGDKINCKSELDIVHFDHEKKTVQIFDNKIAYDNEAFDYAYLKYGYYIQAIFYTYALRYYIDNNGMKEYTILPFKFVVEDSGLDNMKTLIYECTEKDLSNAVNGFKIRGNHYEGLGGAIEAINWSLSSGIFDISKQAWDNNSKMPLKLIYE